MVIVQRVLKLEPFSSSSISHRRYAPLKYALALFLIVSPLLLSSLYLPFFFKSTAPGVFTNFLVVPLLIPPPSTTVQSIVLLQVTPRNVEDWGDWANASAASLSCFWNTNPCHSFSLRTRRWSFLFFLFFFFLTLTTAIRVLFSFTFEQYREHSSIASVFPLL